VVSALKGDVQKGLFFRGAGTLPFGKAVRSVRELIEYLLYGTFPAALDFTTTCFKNIQMAAEIELDALRHSRGVASA
jgi:hypothetical protein